MDFLTSGLIAQQGLTKRNHDFIAGQHKAFRVIQEDFTFFRAYRTLKHPIVLDPCKILGADEVMTPCSRL